MSNRVSGGDFELPRGSEELSKSRRPHTGCIELCDKALSVEEADKVPVSYFVKVSVLISMCRLP